MRPSLVVILLTINIALWGEASALDASRYSSPTFNSPKVLGDLDLEPGSGFGAIRNRPRSFYAPFGGDAAQQNCSMVVATSAVATGSPVWSCYRTEVSIVSGTNAFIWPILATVDYNADTPGRGQHVAITGKAIRRKYAPGGHSANPELWGLLGSIESTTGQPSNVEGGGPIMELDYRADGADPGKLRQGAVTVATRYAKRSGPAVFGAGQVVTSGDGAGGYGPGNVYWTNGFLAAGAFKESALDTRQATMMAGASALWLADDQPISWDTAGTLQTRFDAGTGRLTTRRGDHLLHSLDRSGVTRTNRLISVQGNTTWGSYVVGALPTAANTPELKEGDTAYASNGRKVGQAAGAGTGVPVYYQGNLWHRYSDDATVTQ